MFHDRETLSHRSGYVRDKMSKAGGMVSGLEIPKDDKHHLYLMKYIFGGTGKRSSTGYTINVN